LKREIITTNDGSTTIHLPELNESYHSKHGAIQEAYHVFIKNGLSLFEGKSVSILEIGFGTGLNSFITYLEAQKSNQTIDYVGVEAYPVAVEEALQMNYVKELNANQEASIFKDMHDAYNLIYFDAFGFRVQPELWSLEVFQKMYNALKINGVIVTYACRSSIKNAMIECGFKVEKLPGAPGKREMLRAKKINF
jgi:tRNA U34 5-methylaminomethyl-2-thiouridine-forming methyltransferase MnmC